MNQHQTKELLCDMLSAIAAAVCFCCIFLGSVTLLFIGVLRLYPVMSVIAFFLMVGSMFMLDGYADIIMSMYSELKEAKKYGRGHPKTEEGT